MSLYGIEDGSHGGRRKLCHATQSAGVHTRIFVNASFFNLGFPVLLLLDGLGVALPFFEKLLVLRFDLGFAVLVVTTATSTGKRVSKMYSRPELVQNGCSRQFNIDPPGRVLLIIEHRVVIQLEAGLHAIVIIELNEAEPTALGRLLLLSRNTY